MSEHRPNPGRGPSQPLLRERFGRSFCVALAGHAALAAALFWLTRNTRIFQPPSQPQSSASLIASALEARVANVRWMNLALIPPSPPEPSLTGRIPSSMLDPRNDPESEIVLPTARAPQPASSPPASKDAKPAPPPAPPQTPAKAPPAPAKPTSPTPAVIATTKAPEPPKLTPAPPPAKPQAAPPQPVAPRFQPQPTPKSVPEPKLTPTPAPAPAIPVKAVPIPPAPEPIRPVIVAQPAPAPAIRAQPIPQQTAAIRPALIPAQPAPGGSLSPEPGGIFKNPEAASPSPGVDPASELAAYHAHVKSAYVFHWQQPKLLGNSLQKLRVRAEIAIARDGRVLSAQIIQRSGYEELDQSVLVALDSVRLLQPLPASLPSPTYTVILNFDL